MALGGGTFITQNKVLPGSYINFVSVAKATANLSDRGVVAFPIAMGTWESGKVKTITNDEFQKNSMGLFGYAYTADELKPLRDLFANITKAHLYKLPMSDIKATCSLGTAKLNGVEGNKLKLNIGNTEVDGKTIYQIETYVNDTVVDTANFDIDKRSDWVDNDYWIMNETVTADNLTIGWLYFQNGADGNTIEDSAYQLFLDEIESYTFNTIGYAGTNDTLKQLFATWTKRMRDEVGAKFQCVLHKYETADYEGVISVENDVITGNDNDVGLLVYYVTGAEAGCAVNKTLTNSKYTGEYASVVDTKFTQTELSDGITKGKFIFHKVNDEVKVLEDINTFTSFTEEKSEDFASNQTMRVLDQIANDIASLFARKYLGKMPNDNAGRMSLWNDIVKHHQELEALRAIENFSSNSVVVEPGDSKKSVKVTDYVTPVNAMSKLYMTVYVQ